MDAMLLSYLKVELKGFPSEYLTFKLVEDLIQALKVIVLCDWYNKGERIVLELDLNLIRNLLNKYNQKHLENFLNNSANAFLFVHFFLCQGFRES